MFLNGALIGVTREPSYVVNQIKKLRRKGDIDTFVSVSVSNSTRSIFVACDDGRLCRPYIIVENGRPLLEQHHIDVSLNIIKNYHALVHKER